MKIVTLVSDWAPGQESETSFNEVATQGGATIIASLRVPLNNTDFAPFLQRARDYRPDTLFVFVPSNQAGTLARQFVERGLHTSGIRFVGTGDLSPDDELPTMPEAMLGLVTAYHYSAIHESALNKSFVAAYQKAYGRQPSAHAVAGYDAMHLLNQSITKTQGKTDGDTLIAGMKGMAWESPRGPVSIDPETRDIVQNEYIRRVEKVNGEMSNVEFATIEAVKEYFHGKKR